MFFSIESPWWTKLMSSPIIKCYYYWWNWPTSTLHYVCGFYFPQADGGKHILVTITMFSSQKFLSSLIYLIFILGIVLDCRNHTVSTMYWTLGVAYLSWRMTVLPRPPMFLLMSIMDDVLEACLCRHTYRNQRHCQSDLGLGGKAQNNLNSQALTDTKLFRDFDHER